MTFSDSGDDLMRKTYTFDDVALVPQFNNILSRTEPSLTTWLTRDKKIDIPLVNANMDAVINEEMAQILIQEGTIPIFHRFTSLDKQKEWVKRFGAKIFVSCGLNSIAETRQL